MAVAREKTSLLVGLAWNNTRESSPLRLSGREGLMARVLRPESHALAPRGTSTCLDAAYGLALALQSNGKQDEALPLLADVARARARDSITLTNYGLALVENGNHDGLGVRSQRRGTRHNSHRVAAARLRVGRFGRSQAIAGSCGRLSHGDAPDVEGHYRYPTGGSRCRRAAFIALGCSPRRLGR